MLNSISLVGRAGQDPSDKLKYTPNGQAVLNLSMAVQRDFKNKEDEYDVDWVEVVAWRKTAEFLANNLKKGKLFSVEGRLQVRNYETNEGENRKISEVVIKQANIIEWGDNQQQQDVDVPF